MYRVIFGGSFDPIHLGHLAIADAVHREIAPDQLLWVPAQIAPHKQHLPPAPAADRLALVQAATLNRPQERILDWELQRPAPSYTVHTLRQLKQHDPDGKLDLVLGLDSLSHLASWHRLDEIMQLAGFLFLPRVDCEASDLDNFRGQLSPDFKALFRAQVVQMHRVPVSSTQIRERLAKGDRCQQLLPAAVALEIENRGLYRSD
jgi:nicotinate-nucleotide adenylyltransferase